MLYGVKPKLIYNNNCYILSLKNYSLLSKRVIRNKYPSPNYQDYLSNPVLMSYQALILSNNIAFIEPWGRDLKIISKGSPSPASVQTLLFISTLVLSETIKVQQYKQTQKWRTKTGRSPQIIQNSHLQDSLNSYPIHLCTDVLTTSHL